VNRNSEIPVDSFLNTGVTLERTAMLQTILGDNEEASAAKNIAANFDRNYGDQRFKENQHIANEITKCLNKILEGFKKQKRVQHFYEASKLFDEHN
jgi:hypothetical protein